MEFGRLSNAAGWWKANTTDVSLRRCSVVLLQCTHLGFRLGGRRLFAVCGRRNAASTRPGRGLLRKLSLLCLSPSDSALILISSCACRSNGNHEGVLCAGCKVGAVCCCLPVCHSFGASCGPEACFSGVCLRAARLSRVVLCHRLQQMPRTRNGACIQCRRFFLLRSFAHAIVSCSCAPCLRCWHRASI